MDHSPPPAIELKGLHFSYGKKQVLNNVNIAFPQGKFSVLLGANGSGKSTLFKAITGLQKDYGGDITIMGKDNHALKFKERAMLMGFLSQFHQSVFPFTVEEVLLTGRAAFSGFSPGREDKRLLEEVLTDLGITHLQHANFTHLSGGEQQIVMVGRLLMQQPRIIMLDEPANHLDVFYQHYLLQKLRQHAAHGFTIVAIMHNPTLAYQYADRVYFMHGGNLLPSGGEPDADVDMLQKIYRTAFLSVGHSGIRTVLPVSAIC